MMHRTLRGGLLLVILATPSPVYLWAQTNQNPPGGASLPPADSRQMWVDLHYHWEGHANLDEMIRLSQAQGIKLGVTGEGGEGWGLSNDEKLEQFVGTLQGKPVYKGLQVYGVGWRSRYVDKGTHAQGD